MQCDDVYAEARLKSLKPHEVKQALKDQEEADEIARLQNPAEVKKRRLDQQRHVQLKIIAGTRAGAFKTLQLWSDINMLQGFNCVEFGDAQQPLWYKSGLYGEPYTQHFEKCSASTKLHV